MRTLVRVTMLVIAVAVLVYAALPWWLPTVSTAWLEREGAETAAGLAGHGARVELPVGVLDDVQRRVDQRVSRLAALAGGLLASLENHDRL